MKKIFLLVLLITSLLFFTSCKNSKELSTLALTTAIAVDKKADELEVSILILNHSSISGKAGSEQATILISKSAPTFSIALAKIQLQLQRELFLNHISLLLLDENLAKDGIYEILDFFMRTNNTRSKVALAIAHEVSAKDLLSVILPIEFNPNTKGINSIQSLSENTGFSRQVEILDFMINSNIEGKENVIPSVGIIGNTEVGSTSQNLDKSALDTLPELNGLFVFKDDVVISRIDEDDALNYNFMSDSVKNAYLSFKCPTENNFDVKIYQSDSSLKVTTTDEKITAYINVKSKGEIINYNCGDYAYDKETSSLLENSANEQLVAMFESTVDKIQNTYNSDIFGVGEYLYRYNYSTWKNVKDTWDVHFVNVEFVISNDLTLTKQ